MLNVFDNEFRAGRVSTILVSSMLLFPAISGEAPRDGSMYIDKDAYLKGDQQRTEKGQAVALRAFGKALLKKLGVNLSLHETANFLVFHDLDKHSAKRYLALPEQFLLFMKRMFAIGRGDLAEADKLIVFIWQDRKGYELLAKKIEEVPDRTAERGRGYYSSQQAYPYINLSVNPGRGLHSDPRTGLLKVFAHEYTHAFLERFKSKGNYFAWLDEGFAESISFMILDKTLPALATVDPDRAFYASKLRKRLHAKDLPTITTHMTETIIPADQAFVYAHCWSFVSYLRKYHPRELFKFLKLLKTPYSEEEKRSLPSGKSRAASLAKQKLRFHQAFGSPLEAVEKTFLSWLRKNGHRIEKLLSDTAERDALTLAGQKFEAWCKSAKEGDPLPFLIPAPPPRTVRTGAALAFTPPYSAAVMRLPQLVFRVGKAPDGVKVDPTSGKISWTPGKTQLGKHTLEVVVRVEGGITLTAAKWVIEVVE